MYGSVIKNYLDENGTKHSFVANELGVPTNVFSAMLNNKRKIIVEEYFDICNVLNVDPNYFAQKVSEMNTTTH